MKNIKAMIGKLLVLGTLVFVMAVAVTACGNDKEPAKTEGDTPVSTPTDAPVADPTATTAPTATATPTPIESKITTVTKPGDVEGYSEITSLSVRDIKANSTIQEFDKILVANDYAEGMKLANVTSDDLVAALNENTGLNAETKKVFEDAIKALDANKIDIPKAALYTNLSGIKIEEGNYDNDRAVVFDPFDCVIYINTNVVKTEEEKKEAINIGLGYAALEAYVEEDGEKVLCSPSVYCLDESGEIVEFGGFAKNALAQIIASKAAGKAAISPDDPYFADAVKLTVFLTAAVGNIHPYTYEKLIQDGYKAVVESFLEYGSGDALVKAEDFGRDVSGIDGVETTDKEFIDAYHFAATVITPYLDEMHAEDIGKGNRLHEIYYMKDFIDGFFEEIWGFSFEGEDGYTVLEDGTVVVTKFTKESLGNALHLLTKNY